MITGITIILTAIITGILYKSIETGVERKAEKLKHLEMNNRKFTYSTIGILLEVVIYSGLGLICFSVFFFGEHIVQYVILIAVGCLLLFLAYYRATILTKKRLELSSGQIYYYYGKQPNKVLRIKLNNISYVEMNFLMFHLHMNNDQTIKLPMLFNECSLVYSILKYHRPQ
ncbi:hypothetical protein [Alkalihalobacterium alkalinitrilicum]|uniref:hypothetical protein n=1 Tax=Alkalihalobacterium alkalinitrilicum TaxID=427920 RepID=UPI0009949E6F|nr:hypothetical protein [Alkalihalobacterium alkalinitrilicum]